MDGACRECRECRECTEETGELHLVESTGVGTDTDTCSLDTGEELHGDTGGCQDPEQCKGKDGGVRSHQDCKDSVLCGEDGWDHVWIHVGVRETVSLYSGEGNQH